MPDLLVDLAGAASAALESKAARVHFVFASHQLEAITTGAGWEASAARAREVSGVYTRLG